MQASPKTVDRRRERGKASRNQILQAAVSSIATLGLGNMTLDRVAERAGISRALVVFHFKSKSKLIEEVLEYLGHIHAEGWAALKKNDSASNLERLLQLVDYDIRFAYENPRCVSAWHAFWGESKGNMLYKNLSFPRDQEHAGDLEKLISEIIDEGGYEKQHVQAITMALNAMLFGVWVESHLNMNEEDCERYLHAVRLVLSRFFPDHNLL